MITLSNFWQLLAGLAIFLYGIAQLEDALKQLVGRTFKLFLRKHTDNKLSAIFSGAMVTGVLQSSSVVTFMALSFVGAGVFSMRNALAVVFGSNLGTTLDSWIVATLGFKFNIENFSLPIIAIAGVGLIVFTGYKKLYQLSKFAMGFGLLFLGLGLMKESMDTLIHDFDFARYLHLPGIAFVFLGFIVTAIIQSSSATMVLTLSALNTGALPFEMAVPVIIGSELGTSIKIWLGSVGGIAAKKRVALGNVIFNIVITVFAYLMMHVIIAFIRNLIGINEPLIGLVMFQTIINLVGIVLFFPFLKHFGDFLEKRFEEKAKTSTYFIQDIGSQVPEVTLEVLDKEALLFIYRVIRLNSEAFGISDIVFNSNDEIKSVLEKINHRYASYLEKYDQVKHAEGEILSLYTKLSEEKLDKQDFTRFNQLIVSVRNAMYSAKGIKDIYQDNKDLRDSAVDIKYEQYVFIQSQLREFYTKLNKLLEVKESSSRFEELIRLMAQIQKDYESRMSRIYKHSAKDALEELDISTLLNVNREVYSSCKALILSLKDYLLDATRADDFDNIPVSIIK